MKDRVWRIGLMAALALGVLSLVSERHWGTYGVVAAGALALAVHRRRLWVPQHRWMLLLAVYPVWVAIGLLYAPAEGSLREAIQALPLLILPIASTTLTIDQGKNLARGFVMVWLAAILWMLLRATGLWLLAGSGVAFSHHAFAEGLGRGAPYVSYGLVAAGLLLPLTGWVAGWQRAIAIALGLGLWLLATKMVWLAAGAAAIVFVFHDRLWSWRPVFWWGGAAVAVALFVLLIALPVPRQRWVQLFETDGRLLATEDFRYQDVYIPETELRLVLWREAWRAGVEHRWLGLGTGAQTAALRKRLEALRLPPRIAGLNAHQQYLHTMLAQGVVGLVALLLYWGTWAWLSQRQRNRPLLALTAFFALCGLTECLLARHDGVMTAALALSIAYASGAVGRAAGTRSDIAHTDH